MALRSLQRPGSEPVETIEALIPILEEYLPEDQVRHVTRAFYYAEQAHDGQKRRSGEPYVTHPLAVAHILAEMRLDHQSLMAAMMHDVIEDTGTDKATLATQFGETVADLVDGVSKLTHLEDLSRAEAQAENFQKMALAMARDLRVILVKLADRLHNMRTLGVLKIDKQRRIAKETLEIYAPIAQRLGMHNLRVELEDLSFWALNPMRARRIKGAVERARGNRKEVVEQIRASIEERLRQEGHHAEVLGREKHLYSIYQKLRKKKIFDEIMDIFGFRIIVDDIDTCYRVLGVVHGLFKPVHGKFKDYIAIPRSNGYQSLHTVLIGSHGVPIEIQIRTEDMERLANDGVAAHWLYKTQEDNPASSSHARARQWVQDLLEIQQTAGSSMDFLDNVKVDLFPDEVYVFSPKGKILALPQGSTPVDFAYAVHSDIGDSCVACRINRRLAPLSQPLQSGQTVEIITAPGAQPSPSWLNFVATGKARATIRHFIKHKRHAEAQLLGKRMLEKALDGQGSSLQAIPTAQIDTLLQRLGLKSLSQLLEEIGLGNRVAQICARQLLELESHDSESDHATSDKPAGAAETSPALELQGTEGLVVNFARCCHPIPGDPILGHVSSGRGLVVHMESCHNIQQYQSNADKCLRLNWSAQMSGEYPVELRVELQNSRGIIALLATRINSEDANVAKLQMHDKDHRTSIMTVEITVRDRVHLARVIRRIRSVKSVLRVTRLKH